MTTKNFLFVADVSIAKVVGGAERVLFEQTRRLRQRGHEVHILTRRLPEHGRGHQVLEGVHEWRYDIDRSNDKAFLHTSIRNNRRLFEHLRACRPFDAINFHQPFSSIGVMRSARGCPALKVYTCHSLAFEEFITRNERPAQLVQALTYRLRSALYRWIESRILNRCHRIVTLSSYTRERLQAFYRIPITKVEVIPGGVDLEKFKPHPDRDQIRNKLRIPRDRTVFLTIRNLVPRMGLENLIQAVQRLAGKINDLLVIIGGQGPLQSKLLQAVRESGIGDKIQLIGFISEEQLPEYYGVSDLFVLPTKELEGFGMVTLEALACGIPVVATPVGGSVEILKRFRPDWLFAGTEPEAMAEGLMNAYHSLCRNPSAWKKVSEECRNYAVNFFSWEENIKALEQCLSGELPAIPNRR